MLKLLILVALSLFTGLVQAQNESFTETVLSTGLNYPWELTYGPDNKLWVTESRAYKIQRINPVSGIR